MNAPKNDLQKLKFDPFLFAEYTLKQKLRFRWQLFLTQIVSKLYCSDNKLFSILHLHIRSLKKNFDKFLKFLATLSFNFKIICISEKCWSSEHNNIDLCKLPNYGSIHQTKSSCKTGGGLAIFFHNSLTQSVRKYWAADSEDIEVLCKEIMNSKRKYILVNASYRQPVGRYS